MVGDPLNTKQMILILYVCHLFSAAQVAVNIGVGADSAIPQSMHTCSTLMVPI